MGVFSQSTILETVLPLRKGVWAVFASAYIQLKMNLSFYCISLKFGPEMNEQSFLILPKSWNSNPNLCGVGIFWPQHEQNEQSVTFRKTMSLFL